MEDKNLLKKEIKLGESGVKESVRFGFILVLPALIMLLFIVIFPLLASIYLSLSEWSPLTGGGTFWYEAYKFWGWLANYWNILRDADFLMAILRTFIIVIVVVPIEFFIGLGLAFLFRENFFGKKVFHSIILMPMMIVPAVAGFVFYMLFQAQGPVNSVLSGIAFREVSILWLQNNVTAMIAIMIADIWQWSPFMFLILLSGLMSLPEDQINAAVILGASKWQRFRMVLFPLMKPVIVIALIFRGMEAVKIFDAIWLMTTGGPGTATESISVYMYKHGFKHLRWSWVAAGGIIILIIITLISMQALKPIREQEEKEA
ncbi:MAG: sugar ABC transporter permease [Spirochaetota bacterium]|nr:MAG: sugar ABC transporter permease [Spirochaetota bacterium]